MIQPTPGRVVWFHPNAAYPNIAQHDRSQPLAAMVAYVWSNRMVNLSVIDQNGASLAVTSVQLLQDDDVPHVGGAYAEWMPFQKGQAEKADAANDKVDEGVIRLTKAEIQSGLNRVRWAEDLIRQLPESHDGRNSWLQNFGSDKN